MADTVGEQQGLIEFSLPEPVGMQRNRHEHIHIQAIGQRRDEQCAQRVSQRDLAPILEQGS